MIIRINNLNWVSVNICCSETLVYPLQELLSNLESKELSEAETLNLQQILSFPESIDVVQTLLLQCTTKNPQIQTVLQRVSSSDQLSASQRFILSCTSADIMSLQTEIVSESALLRYRDAWGSQLADGTTLLHLAILHKQTDIVKYLIETAPTIINQPSSLSFLPLHVACLVRDEGSVQSLLKKGTDVNGSSAALRPLFLACFSEAPRIIEILVGTGAAIDASPTLMDFTRS
jgi:ankyrin repeat protein